jgi:hypothetical protein
LCFIPSNHESGVSEEQYKCDVKSTSGVIILAPSLSGLAVLNAPIVILLAAFVNANRDSVAWGFQATVVSSVYYDYGKLRISVFLALRLTISCS